MLTKIHHAAALVAIVMAMAGVMDAQQPRVGILKVQGNVYLLAMRASNVVAQIGDDGVLLVDTGTPDATDDILAAVRTLSDKPVRWIINTSFDRDHTGGNEALSRAGIGTPQNQFGSGRAFPGSLPSGAVIVAHEAVLTRMSAPTGVTPPTPQGAWPVGTYIGAGREMFFNGESIQIFHEPAAHTDGDSIVYFRQSDVAVAGDIFTTTGYPVIDLKTGGTIEGVVAGLNHLLDIVIPKEKEEGGTYVIPGHGRVADEGDLVAYRNMVTIIRDRVRDQIKQGMTLDRIKAAKPAAGYDRRWASPAWTSDMFVESAYRTLTASTPSATAQR
jgi:glyoxylase-like metal-dependent hydrolase (beta-lactamase superfamily II)